MEPTTLNLNAFGNQETSFANYTLKPRKTGGNMKNHNHTYRFRHNLNHSHFS
ncbi:MAG: hypothetical protein M1540_09690 [Candidatus Bathyarchaeota archaeon]|nr:hypothetical protein [Candidatus Bathyarchaeota archaeon]